jgi:hypothetical protein
MVFMAATMHRESRVVKRTRAGRCRIARSHLLPAGHGTVIVAGSLHAPFPVFLPPIARARTQILLPLVRPVKAVRLPEDVSRCSPHHRSRPGHDAGRAKS